MAPRILTVTLVSAVLGLASVSTSAAFNMHVPKSVLVDPVRTGSILPPSGAPDGPAGVCVPSEMPTNALPTDRGSEPLRPAVRGFSRAL